MLNSKISVDLDTVCVESAIGFLIVFRIQTIWIDHRNHDQMNVTAQVAERGIDDDRLEGKVERPDPHPLGMYAADENSLRTLDLRVSTPGIFMGVRGAKIVTVNRRYAV